MQSSGDQQAAHSSQCSWTKTNSSEINPMIKPSTALTGSRAPASVRDAAAVARLLDGPRASAATPDSPGPSVSRSEDGGRAAGATLLFGPAPTFWLEANL